MLLGGGGGWGGGYLGFLRLGKEAKLVTFFRVHRHVPSCAQIVILDFEKCVLHIDTECVFTLPHHTRKLCVQNRLMLYGLLIQSASDHDPYSGPTLGKGGGGCFASSITSERRRAKGSSVIFEIFFKSVFPTKRGEGV